MDTETSRERSKRFSCALAISHILKRERASCKYCGIIKMGFVIFATTSMRLLYFCMTWRWNGYVLKWLHHRKDECHIRDVLCTPRHVRHPKHCARHFAYLSFRYWVEITVMSAWIFFRC